MVGYYAPCKRSSRSYITYSKAWYRITCLTKAKLVKRREWSVSFQFAFAMTGGFKHNNHCTKDKQHAKPHFSLNFIVHKVGLVMT